MNTSAQATQANESAHHHEGDRQGRDAADVPGQAAEGLVCEVGNQPQPGMNGPAGFIINILDPHAIVLGGGLSRIAQLYRRVPERWKEYVFSERDSIATRLLPPKYGDSSGVRGAAWLWPESA